MQAEDLARAGDRRRCLALKQRGQDEILQASQKAKDEALRAAASGNRKQRRKALATLRHIGALERSALKRLEEMSAVWLADRVGAAEDDAVKGLAAIFG